MRILKQQFVWLLAVFVLSACVGVKIDSLNKRFAAFEIGYKSLLVQIDSLEKGNSLKPDTKAKLAKMLPEINRARTAAYAAKNVGDVVGAQDKIGLALALLEQVKLLIPAGGQL